MKYVRHAILAAALFVASLAPALAQWQVPQYSVPIGRGGGTIGFDNAAPGAAGLPLVSTGPTSAPAFGSIGDSTLRATGKGLFWNGTTLAYGWLTPTGPTLDLRDCMDTVYGVGAWTQYSGVGTGSDIGPALALCYNKIATNFGNGVTGRGRIIMPIGVFALKTSNTDLSGVCLIGPAGSQGTSIVYELSSGVALIWSGKNNYTGGCFNGITLSIDSGIGLSTATPLLLQGNCPSGTSATPPCWMPDQWTSEDIYISTLDPSPTGSYWLNGPLFDGSARTAPQGIRVGTIKNWQLFGMQNYAFFAKNLVQWTIENLGTYVGYQSNVGVLTGMDVWFSGNGASLTNTTQVDARGLVVGGRITLTNTNNVTLNGLASNLLAASSATAITANLQLGNNLSAATPPGAPSIVHVLNHDAPPGVSSCGTSPSAATGGDYEGQVTEGSTATGCTITFTKAWNATPRCTVNAQNGTSVAIAAIGTTQLSWSHASSSGAAYNWRCSGF